MEQDPFDRGRPVECGRAGSTGATSEARRPGAEGLPHSSPTSCPLFLIPKFPRATRVGALPSAYKLDILRRADACGGHGELGQLLRAEGLYSSHLGTWRQQREAGLMPKTRGRKPTAVDPQLKKLEQENRRLTSRLRRAEALLAFQKKFPSSYRSP